MNSLIKQKVKEDLELLVTIPDSDNRGLSDHMLFYLNVYPYAGKFKRRILNKVRELVEKYNESSTTDLFSMLFFELYYNTLRIKCKYQLKGRCKVFTNIVYNQGSVREFIKLYHNFGLFWAQHTNLVNPLLKEKCREIDPGNTFIQLMNQLKKEIYLNHVGISWTHNHYAYFSTLFFTQKEPLPVRIDKQRYTKYIRKTLSLAMGSKYSIDYIGECVECLLRYGKTVNKEVIEYIVNYVAQDNSYHYLVTGSIVPLSICN